METIDRFIINQNLDTLARLINMEILWPKLIEHQIFFTNYPEFRKWQNNLNDQSVKKSILIEIQTRGPHAFQNLIRSLEETDQDNCAQILTRTNLTYDPLNAVKPLKIDVKKSTSFHDDLNNVNLFDTYPMKSKPRGLVLIISLYNINDSKTNEKSAEYDEKNLRDLFDQMGFKVIVEKNLNAMEIKQKAKEFSKNPELRTVDCAFFIVVGNNVQDINYVSMSLINTNREDFRSANNIVYGDLMHYFNGQNCPNLLNKPKIFIFHLGSSIHVHNAVITVNGDDDPAIEFNLRDISRQGESIKSRNYSDMLISFSTMSDNTFGITKNGSLFGQVLCEVFMKYSHNIHVKDLLKMAHGRSKLLRAKNQNVSSFLISIGFKRCFINPGMFD